MNFLTLKIEQLSTMLVTLDNYLITAISSYLSPEDALNLAKVSTRTYNTLTKDWRSYILLNMKALCDAKTQFAKVSHRHIASYLNAVLEQGINPVELLVDLDMPFDKFSFIISSLPPASFSDLVSQVNETIELAIGEQEKVGKFFITDNIPYRGRAAYNVFHLLSRTVVPEYLEYGKAKDFEGILLPKKLQYLKRFNASSDRFVVEALLSMLENEVQYRDEFEYVLKKPMSRFNKGAYVLYTTQALTDGHCHIARFLLGLRPAILPLVEYKTKKLLSRRLIKQFRAENGRRKVVPKELKNPDFNLIDYL